MLDTQTWPPPPPRVNRAKAMPYIVAGAALLIVGIVLAAFAIANAQALGGACGLSIIAGVTVGTGLLLLMYAYARGQLRV